MSFKCKFHFFKFQDIIPLICIQRDFLLAFSKCLALSTVQSSSPSLSKALLVPFCLQVPPFQLCWYMYSITLHIPFLNASFPSSHETLSSFMMSVCTKLHINPYIIIRTKTCILERIHGNGHGWVNISVVEYRLHPAVVLFLFWCLESVMLI